jgi:CTP synthase
MGDERFGFYVFFLKAKPKLKEWKSAIKKKPQENITIAIAGKYTALEDSYASVVEALNHAGTTINTKINIKWLDTESIDSNKKTRKLLEGVDGVIVPGGFGSRGIDGKLKVIEYCRTEKIPYLGICYGLQLAVIEFMRNVCGYEKAHSTEVDPKTPVPVIYILPDKKNLTNLGGTLRLGAYKAKLLNNSLVKKLYDNKTEVYERHRHRFEVNPEYHCTLQEKGMVFSGLSPDAELVEFIKLPADKHPYFVATQAHPELKSKPLRPSPLFLGLVEASKKRKNKPVKK